MKSMSSEAKPSPFSPAVEKLVAHERAVPVESDEVRARLLSRAHAATLEGPPAPTPRLPRASASPAVAGALGLAVVGVAVALYLWRASTPSAPPAVKAPVTVPVAPPSAAVTPAVAATSEPTSASDTASEAAASAGTAVPNPRATSSSPKDGGLEEIQLLSRARKADAQGDYAEVLSILGEHERRFPGGRLSEEREVLRVKALVGLGRSEQAKRAGARFRRGFPHSVLLHKVDEMLASLP
jgi:hypothetical protein